MSAVYEYNSGQILEELKQIKEMLQSLLEILEKEDKK